MFQTQTGDHLYTTSPDEIASANQQGYATEGIAFRLEANPRPGTVPLYRMFDGRTHYFSTTGQLDRPNAQREGVMGYMPARRIRGTVVPLTAWSLPQSGLLFFTTDPNGELAPQGGYQYAGVVGYVYPPQ
jgi:hypothetical protein